MNMNFDLSLQQTQKLIMTQQLQLAIKILQLPSIELNEYIQNQLEENPVLEASNNDGAAEEPKIDWKKAARDLDNNDYYENYSDDDENVSPLNFIASTLTLRDHLIIQLHIAISDQKDSQIGEYLLDNIDSAGYLRIDAQDTAMLFGVNIERVESIIEIIQSFDPPGIGARTIEECLTIQLKQQGLLTELLEIIINKYLKEIGENKYNTIAKELGITPRDAQAAGDIIKSLEPKPGRGFGDNSDIKYIIPDVFIERAGSQYIVLVNDRTTPRLSINQYYRNILNNGMKDGNIQEYVRKKLDSAAWLIKSIEQRRTTIYNVVNSIVKFQEDFLNNGMNCLRPLTLKEVAEDIGVHESTVSRAVNGKYVQTPRGLFPLKFFFTRGLDACGDNISSESIKKSIRDMLTKEDPKKPLSDQRITDILNKKGINISRRTVAKYREEMDIPPTSRRKRY